MTDLTPEQIEHLAEVKRRGDLLLAYLKQISRLETAATASGKVYDPELMLLARQQLRISMMAAEQAITGAE